MSKTPKSFEFIASVTIPTLSSAAAGQNLRFGSRCHRRDASPFVSCLSTTGTASTQCRLLHDDGENMSGSMRGKLFTQFWESASPFFSATTRQRPLASSTAKWADLARKSFSQNRHYISSTAVSQRTSQYALKRSFASSGILLFGLNTTTTASNSALSSCTSVIEKKLYTAKALRSRKVFNLETQIWCKAIHSTSGQRENGALWENKGPLTEKPKGQEAVNDTRPGQPNPATKQPENDAAIGEPTNDSGSSSYFQLPHLPKLPHRPTKEELLAAATGFWSRLRVRFKWFSIRSVRPWNVDDWSAFISWFLLGHIVWILVGTTTFFSLLIFSINTVVAQGEVSCPKFDSPTDLIFQKHWLDGSVII